MDSWVWWGGEHSTIEGLLAKTRSWVVLPPPSLMTHYSLSLSPPRQAGVIVTMSNRVDYWWPGAGAINTRNYLLFEGQRYNSGETLVMKEITSTLENTLATDGVYALQFRRGW
jgi:hypothetical protein